MKIMSNPADCQEYTELLSAYLDAELDAAEKAAVDQHLASCSACSKQLKELKLVSGALQGMKKVEFSKELDFSFLDSPAASPALSAASPHLGVGMSQCAPIIELLNAYHDGELCSDEKVLVDEHIKDCQPCVERLSEIKMLVDRIKSLPKLEAPRDIVGAMNFESPAKVNSAKDNLVTFPRKAKFAICTAAAAAVALIFAFNFKLVGQQDIASNSGTTKAPVEISQNQNLERVAPTPDEDNKAAEQSKIANDVKQSPAASIVKEEKNPAESKAVQQQQIAQQVNPPAVQIQMDDSSNAIALMPDSFGSDGTDALGIGTDEDGLYDIKI